MQLLLLDTAAHTSTYTVPLKASVAIDKDSISVVSSTHAQYYNAVLCGYIRAVVTDMYVDCYLGSES